MDSLLGELKENNLHISLQILALLLVALTGCASQRTAGEQGEVLYRQGQHLAFQGKTAKAEEKFKESMAYARQAGFKAGEAHNLNELAILHTSRGECAKARDLLGQALQIYKNLVMEAEISKSMHNIAITYVREKRYDPAIARFSELLEWDRKTGNRLGEAITLYNIGILYQKTGRPLETRRVFSQARVLFECLGHKKYLRMIPPSAAGLED